jgi:hypothetical protein
MASPDLPPDWREEIEEARAVRAALSLAAPPGYAADAVKALIRNNERNEDAAFKLYIALAFFDTRSDTALAQLVAAAREGYEYSHPHMNEENPWDDFDRIRARINAGGMRKAMDEYLNAWRHS